MIKHELEVSPGNILALLPLNACGDSNEYCHTYDDGWTIKGDFSNFSLRITTFVATHEGLGKVRYKGSNVLTASSLDALDDFMLNHSLTEINPEND